MLFFFHKDNANVDVDATGEFFLYTNRYSKYNKYNNKISRRQLMI